MHLKTISCQQRWRYYCPFCDQDITPPDGYTISSFIQCQFCPVTTNLIVNGSISNPNIAYIQFQQDQFMIELNQDDQTTILFAGPVNARLSQMLKLSYLVPVNPNNFHNWLSKLLNLKAFS